MNDSSPWHMSLRVHSRVASRIRHRASCRMLLCLQDRGRRPRASCCPAFFNAINRKVVEWNSLEYVDYFRVIIFLCTCVSNDLTPSIHELHWNSAKVSRSAKHIAHRLSAYPEFREEIFYVTRVKRRLHDSPDSVMWLPFKCCTLEHRIIPRCLQLTFC